jgi:hypothetical protein
MDSQLTVGDARPLLYTAAQLNDPNDPQFLVLLNQACERLLYSGKWEGSIVKVLFAGAPFGYISLPFRYLSALAANYYCTGIPIFSQFHRYVESGPGFFLGETLDDQSQLFWRGELIDQGDDYPTDIDVISPGGIQLFSSGIDNGKTARIFGIQAETGKPVYDNQGEEGEELVLTFPFTQSIYRYSAIYGFQKQATKGKVDMWVLPDSGVNYLISSYQPPETRPNYHRYQVGKTDKPIRTLCQRRFVPMIVDTDWVIPGNIGALKYALQALVYEDLNRNDDAKQQWEYSYLLLNQQTRSTRGGARVDVPIPTLDWGCSFDQTN